MNILKIIKEKYHKVTPDTTQSITKAFFEELCVLESVYRECLAYELRKTGPLVEQEKALPLVYEEVRLESAKPKFQKRFKE